MKHQEGVCAWPLIHALAILLQVLTSLWVDRVVPRGEEKLLGGLIRPTKKLGGIYLHANVVVPFHQVELLVLSCDELLHHPVLRSEECPHNEIALVHTLLLLLAADLNREPLRELPEIQLPLLLVFGILRAHVLIRYFLAIHIEVVEDL